MDGSVYKGRLAYIDVLRGIAVILMIEQHLGFWLWNRPKGFPLFSDYPVVISFNALGGMAAPLFIILAGVGTAFFILNHSEIDKTLFLRGCLI